MLDLHIDIILVHHFVFVVLLVPATLLFLIVMRHVAVGPLEHDEVEPLVLALLIRRYVLVTALLDVCIECLAAIKPRSIVRCKTAWLVG